MTFHIAFLLRIVRRMIQLVRLVNILNGMEQILLLLVAVACAAAQPVNLAGPWKLNLAEELRWAQPVVDDSNWPAVNLPQRYPRNEPVYWLRRAVPGVPVDTLIPGER